MKKLNTLNDLLLEQAMSLYNAELQVEKELQNIIEKANSPELRRILKRYYENVLHQRARLHFAFDKLKHTNVDKSNDVIKIIIIDLEDIMSRSTDQDITDAAIRLALRQIINYKITGYGAIREIARVLNLENIAQHFTSSLVEEKHINELLIKLERQTLEFF